jgi:hypothetical protein
MLSSAAEPLASRPTWRTSMASAIVATLSRPSSWAVCLAGFLARGGILLFILPLVRLPTTASLANQVVPVLQPSIFGTFTGTFIGFIAVLVGVFLAWLIAGGLIGAWGDVTAIREALADEEIGGWERATQPAGRSILVRVMAARIVAHVPLMAWLIVIIPAVFVATYAELTNPGEVISHLFLRTLAHVPVQAAVLVVLWWLGEAAGGLAARRIVVDDAPIGRAVAGGWSDLARHALTAALTLLATTLGLALAVVPALLAASFGWRFVRLSVPEGRWLEAVVSVTAFVLIWLGGLVIAAAAAAWRSHAWTAEWLRWRVARDAPAVPAER